jgi:hypothetical protein
VAELYEKPKETQVLQGQKEETSTGLVDETEDEDMLFYLQPRYACGQLYIGNVVCSMAANTLYNPSLSPLVSTMIASKVVMVEVPKDWSGKTYVEYFDYLLWSRELLALGIYRRGEYKGPRQRDLDKARVEQKAAEEAGEEDDSDLDMMDDDMEMTQTASATEVEAPETKSCYLYYVYTAPPGKRTLILETDQIICFSLSAVVQAERERDAEVLLEDAQKAAKRAARTAEVTDGGGKVANTTNTDIIPSTTQAE